MTEPHSHLPSRESIRTHLVAADQLLTHAIDAVRLGDRARAAQLVGRSGHRVASALQHLRLATHEPQTRVFPDGSGTGTA